ncbi:unnamed protein product [Cyprideis torosa]|uniref:Prolyl endopeptidase n=1 Tax=Cyprideis torosa TaxID=163714 RepID=A0A7R8WUB9_9CRUS|nr:unnamed protein product [Cyprideis torosa]CAG0906789.1 unnamed protein product [Cyprideis torosa]
MAEGFEYYQLSGVSISPDNRLASFGVDQVSRRIYTISIKNLESNELLDDELKGTTGRATWSADGAFLFYTKKDPETLRAHQIYRHKLGDAQELDVLVYEEQDDTFTCHVGKSKSRELIVITSSSTETSEQRFIRTDAPLDDFRVIEPRQRGLEYYVEHFEDHFYLYTNADGAKNYKVMRCPIDRCDRGHWEELIPHREEVLLDGFEIFKKFLVLEEREKGNLNIHIRPWEDPDNAYYMSFDEEVYTAYTSTNLEFDTTILRYGYTSLRQPTQVIDFDMEKQTKEVKKEQEVVDANFKVGNYHTEKLWVTARDGKQVAVSLIRHKDTMPSRETPLLLYGYGSYGHTVDPVFSVSRLSLLDRGFIFAIAHIRGSSYLGRSWYEDGKMLHKLNTFYDFIDAAEFLIELKYTSTPHLYAMGGSAGGLLMGAVMNMRPELFNGIISKVPFVDVLTTMLDETIPLTTGEFDEWGNPKEKTFYEYIKSYSPYDNLKDQSYPHLLMTTGLHDSQVQYWEPAKYIAKMRQFENNPALVLFKTDMGFGHGGASGRFQSIKEIALDYAFLLALEDAEV